LLPEYARDVIDPGDFDFGIVGFHDDGFVGLPLSEPDFKASTRLTHIGRETNVRGFHTLLVDVDVQILAFGITFGFAEQDQIFEEEDVSESLLPALPAVELALPQKSALLFDVDVTVPQRIHGQEIVAVTQLEADHLLGRLQVPELGLLVTALLEQLLQQQRVLAHPLHRFQ